MINNRKELRFYIAADRIMRGEAPEASLFDRICRWLGITIKLKGGKILEYQRNLRYVDYFSNRKHLNIIERICYLCFKYRYNKYGEELGFSIAPGVFGYGLYIPHYGTIVVGANNTIGNYAVLHTSICIAATGSNIGDSFYISPGGKITKAVKLGNNITLGANSILNKSVIGDNKLLIGSPAIEKSCSKAWWERDGIKYYKRIELIERLKKEQKI